MADLSIGQSQGVFITNIIDLKYFCPYTQKEIQTYTDVLFQEHQVSFQILKKKIF